ncbi:bifunctional acetaldehyde-CoA/alcohol dehydrogenase [Clostridium thermosuccinogenes]|jgi:acetaldehyde dehydrogenase/alcohol dehydrogenase|uniref:Aldehyde-alcohol dehydrogenase n=1 Tax=Clostridium thermosuccinogenes TaxID=84032 RepID=A0A2K2EYJ3_9CLOT|nr:bifunctional acetaldehyde-CoA/alcohol dehydrogenase [Pseudoclostridium thermosuccinogenes]AUS95204.1 bifunctional acetaldehyde-CoA/alcohol dehydrogenase [Pseudoclostridium thermosuccinogenes]PNT91582.1 bifunctional acetaldehyde-CoA/alcohol dehydrogenase [Pseudoclostridium thermosuccinogenes]PNT96762.1 bifunctional acetaldehyde-CoA/alcohol dehydrogenase [Pseudoclostridium thermosuccinogenes]PNT98599.1 bifunctional acetaldehyde-CoA/alcohol dehydrogenase [Pseudoclostridium thermosuccinogenes]
MQKKEKAKAVNVSETLENTAGSIEALKEKLDAMRKAQKVFATYTQEQVDEIFSAAARAANQARIPLARMAVEETGMGVVEDKVIKNHYASEYIYNNYKYARTCGVIEEDRAFGIKKIAEPVGLIAAVIPTTNPTSTAIFKTLLSLKTRNAIMVSPHPRAKKSTIAAAKIVLDAAVKAGAPEGIIGWIDNPSVELTKELMREADLILATGGPGMVKAAYSSGKPAIGVGPGNTPAIIDDTADIKLAVNSIIHSKTFDNGMICASEQSVIVLAKVYDEVRKEFIYRGCYFLKPDELDKVRKTIVINGELNPGIVGQSAYNIAKLAGVDVPETTKILIGEVESTDLSEEFAYEKLSPVLAMYKAENFEEALEKAEKLIAAGGYGHTSSLFINTRETEKMAKHAQRMKTCRILINTPSSQGGIGDLYNFMLTPSLTLGCGTWGGNSVSDNVGIKHLLNIKTVAERRENMLWFRAPEKVYFKRGCLPVALNELKYVLNKKKVFIVTDSFLYKNGYTRCVTDKLDELGIAHTTFYDVQPDPTLSSAIEGAKAMRSFEPDCIIAIGGGSAMDAGKIMWVMYEHPEVDFMDLAMRFMDIRKRVYSFPKMGEKAYFVAIPTTSGTGSECTPFAVITDDRTGIKYPLADYELMPDMAIVDADNMMNQPKSLTSASGIDTLTHAIEAYVSVMATDYTDGLALKAMKNVFLYLPRAYEYGAEDPVAREKMADASCIAGMAFANAFLGLNHSMAHKLGAYHHLPHGVANALLLTEVMKYNAAEAPAKMGTFPQYGYPNALARYAECARFCGVDGKDDREVFEKFLSKIEDLKAAVGIKKTIAEYGIKEEDFLATLDEMVENAFDDQCTGTNPRYPLMSEIKEIYLKCYYGK